MRENCLILSQNEAETWLAGEEVWELSQLDWLAGGYYTDWMCMDPQLIHQAVEDHLVLNCFICHSHHLTQSYGFVWWKEMLLRYDSNLKTFQLNIWWPVFLCLNNEVGWCSRLQYCAEALYINICVATFELIVLHIMAGCNHLILC